MGEILNKFRIGAIWKATVNAKRGKGRDYVIINVGGTCHRITHRTPTGGYRRIATTRGRILEFVLR